MRKAAKITLGATAALALGAGAAHAASAQFHTMNVTLPDGAVAHILYAGDTAPKVEVRAADDTIADTDTVSGADFDSGFAPVSALALSDPFMRMERIAAMMDRRMEAMMQHAAQLRQQAVAHGVGTPEITLVGNLPAGAHFSYVSTSTDSTGCTRTVSYSSDGTANAAPQLTRTASSGCDAAAPAARAQAPEPQASAPGHTT